MVSSEEAVSVIIPNWNGAERLRKLLPSLAQQQPIGELIVVDNGSSDDSLAVSQDSGGRVIPLTENLGFAAAVNRGITEATGRWLLILNNDVELGPRFLELLLSRASARSAWFAAGKLFNACHRDIIDGTFDTVCRGGTAWRCGAGQPDFPAVQKERLIYFAPFTAVLVRKELFARVGMLDSTFESYLEDVDFGFRCANQGLMGVYVPEAVAYHEGSGTLGAWHPETVRRISRNQVLLVAKHLCNWHNAWPAAVAQSLWGLLSIRHGAGLAWLRGKVEGLRASRRFRGEPVPDSILEQSEQLIRDHATDLYWRLYFALT